MQLCNLVAKLRFYVVQTGPLFFTNNERYVKIGYYDEHPDGNITKYYLAANQEDDYEVSITEVSN